MHKLLLVILCSPLVNNISYARHSGDSMLVIPKNKWFLKISPLSIFETDGGICFSSEYLIARKKIGFQLEVQPILFSVAKNGYKFDQPKGIVESGRPSGVKLRTEVRYYFKGLRSESYYQHFITGFNGKPVRVAEPIRIFIGVNFLCKNVQTERVNDFVINRGSIQYINPLKAMYTDVKKVYGFDLNIGSVSQSFPNPHYWVEAFIGIGGRLKFFSYRSTIVLL